MAHEYEQKLCEGYVIGRVLRIILLKIISFGI